MFVLRQELEAKERKVRLQRRELRRLNAKMSEYKLSLELAAAQYDILQRDFNEVKASLPVRGPALLPDASQVGVIYGDY